MYRGSNEQVAVSRHAIDAVTNTLPRIEEGYVQFSETMRNYEDMLIVYSTIPGFVSYRDEYNGTWFIQILCEVFMNYAHKVHVRELFDMVSIKNIENNFSSTVQYNANYSFFSRLISDLKIFVQQMIIVKHHQ